MKIVCTDSKKNNIYRLQLLSDWHIKIQGICVISEVQAKT